MDRNFHRLDQKTFLIDIRTNSTRGFAEADCAYVFNEVDRNVKKQGFICYDELPCFYFLFRIAIFNEKVPYLVHR